MTSTSLTVRDEGIESLWNPHRLVSLWDMIEHHCKELCRSVERIGVLNGLVAVDAEGRVKSRVPIDDDLKETVLDELNDLAKAVEAYDMRDIIEHIQHKRNFFSVTNALTKEVVYSELHSLLNQVSNKLGERKFVYVPLGKTTFFQNGNLLGSNVCQKFPNITQDIIDAGNCTAVGIHNAAVNGWLRIAEIGLKKFAWYCRIQSPGNNPAPLTPDAINGLTWSPILKAIDVELKRRVQTLSPNRKSAIAYCLKVYGPINSLYGYRNENAHARSDYEEGDVDNVYGLTKSFMDMLAKRVSSRQRTQIPIT